MTDPRGVHSAHLDAETIAALVDRTLDPAARAAAEAHLAGCADCRDVWMDTSEIAHDTEVGGWASAPAAADAPAPRPGSRARWWMYRGAGLAVAAALALVVFSPRLFDRGDRPEVRELVEAVGANRFTEARLTGGFQWGPVPSANRSATDETRIPAGVEVAVAELRREAEEHGTPAALAAYGSASLIAGRLDDAVGALEDVTALAPSDARAWSDLSAAYLARSRRAADAVDLPRALDAADTALRIDAALLEARFNRALALERLGLKPEAIAAWSDYATHEKDPQWREEGRRRASALANQESGRPPDTDAQPSRDRFLDEVLPRWAASDDAAAGEAAAEASALAATLERLSNDRFITDVLAEAPRAQRDRQLRDGYAAYGRGREEYKRNAHERAFVELERARALLEAAGSPVAIQAQLYAAITLFRQVRHDEAWDRLMEARAAVGRRPYFALNGRIDWMLGTLAAAKGRPYDAIGHYRMARDHFEASREWANVGVMESISAFAYDQLGDARRAWPLRLSGLARSDRDGMLLSAADAALRLSWLNVADILLEAAATRAGAAGRFPSVADARRAQAETELRRGNSRAARARVMEAYAAASRLDGATRDGRLTEIALTEARVADRSTAAAAWNSLQRAEPFLTTSGQRGRLPELFTARARLLRVEGRYDEAGRALEAALEAHDRARANLPPEMQASFADALRETANELVDLHLQTGSHVEAAETVDWLKGRDLDATQGVKRPLTAPPDGTTALLYFVRDDSVLAWAISGESAMFRETALDRARLTALVRSAGWPSFSTEARKRLAEILIAPFGQFISDARTTELLIIPDGALHGLAFASLAGRAKRFLIEEHAVTISPSLGAFQRARGAPSGSASLLALGNPVIDAHAFPELPELPESVLEVEDLSGIYASPATFIGAAATRQILLDGLRSSDVVHFAGHALVNEAEPDLSSLVIPGGGHPSISARDIRALSGVRARLVVLASCRGSGGVGTHTEGPLSLARAFIAAGVPRVLASHWPAEDRSSRALLVRFHQEYARGTGASEALRRAQLALAASADPGLSTPAAWSGFALIEAGSNSTTDRRQAWR